MLPIEREPIRASETVWTFERGEKFLDSTRIRTPVSIQGRGQAPPFYLHATSTAFLNSSLLQSSAFSQNHLSNVCHCRYTVVTDEVLPCFFSVVRQIPGYNSQRRGTARTSQFSFLCIIFRSLYYVYCFCVCDVLLPPGVHPTAVKYIYIYIYIYCHG
jgi:hypothetical protein